LTIASDCDASVKHRLYERVRCSMFGCEAVVDDARIRITIATKQLAKSSDVKQVFSTEQGYISVRKWE